jgi:glycosyltransferase involved in cell wall biosynthesis
MMDLLVILPRIPLPARDGGAIVMIETLKALAAAGHSVDVAVVNTRKHRADPAVLAPFVRSVHAVDVDTTISAFGALRSLVRPRLPRAFGIPTSASYWVARFASEDMLSAVIDRVRSTSYDAVLCETLFTACYGVAVRRLPMAPPVILRAHNVEHRIQERLAADPLRSAPQRWYRGMLARQTAGYEAFIARTLDAVATVSDDDAEYFTGVRGSRDGVRSVPPGIAIPETSAVRPDPLSIGFLGSLDWEPNVDGVHWFVREILPLIRRSRPDAVFHIAGRRPPEHVRALHDGVSVVVHGEIDDAHAMRSTWAINVVPLRSGSGIRIKILETLAGGAAVVSTTVGCEGLGMVDGEQLVIADDAQHFADVCVELLTDPERAQALARRGRDAVRERFAWPQAIARLEGLIRESASVRR